VVFHDVWKYRFVAIEAVLKRLWGAILAHLGSPWIGPQNGDQNLFKASSKSVKGILLEEFPLQGIPECKWILLQNKRVRILIRLSISQDRLAGGRLSSAPRFRGASWRPKLFPNYLKY
jgi:hypothetical protein